MRVTDAGTRGRAEHVGYSRLMLSACRAGKQTNDCDFVRC